MLLRTNVNVSMFKAFVIKLMTGCGYLSVASSQNVSSRLSTDWPTGSARTRQAPPEWKTASTRTEETGRQNYSQNSNYLDFIVFTLLCFILLNRLIIHL